MPTNGAKPEASGEASPTHEVEVPSAKAAKTPRKASKPKAKAKGKPSKGRGNKSTDLSSAQIEAKQRNARKSKAYRRAYKEAQDNGLSAEECGAAGRKAP